MGKKEYRVFQRQEWGVGSVALRLNPESSWDHVIEEIEKIDYQWVMTYRADDLSEVFYLGNEHTQTWGDEIALGRLNYSLSIGDIVQDPWNEYWLCMMQGWKRLPGFMRNDE